MTKKDTRYVHVYTGQGKGKTTACLGLVLRALGAGWRVLFAQFLKNDEYSEIKALKRFVPQVEVRQFGSGRFVRGRPTEEDIRLAERGLHDVEQDMISSRFDMIVLDEINVAIHFGLVSLQRVLSFLEKRPKDMELVLTGRWAPNELIEQADLVTEMKEVKHYFRNGVAAREGIEK